MTKRTNPLDAPGIDWQKEERACHLYLEERTGITQPQKPPIIEAAAACIYEYAREVFFEIQGDLHCSFFLDRDPFTTIAEQWSRADGKPYPSLPWPSLSDASRSEVKTALQNGYKAPPKLETSILIHLLRRTFDRLREKAWTLADLALADTSGKYDDESLFAPSLETPDFPGEHVVFTIDYRESKDRLVRAFKLWLDSRKPELKKHRIKLNGELYRHRLKDLAVLRLSRRVGPKLKTYLAKLAQARGLTIEDYFLERGSSFDSSLSESRGRAESFRDHLRDCEFDNIRHFERDLKNR